MKKIALRNILPLAAGVFLLAGCVVEQPAPPPGPEAPPPPESEVVPPQPDMTFVWTPGVWDWSGRRWVWRHGYWGPRSHPGAIWVQGHWGRHGHWVRAHWQ